MIKESCCLHASSEIRSARAHRSRQRLRDRACARRAVNISPWTWTFGVCFFFCGVSFFGVPSWCSQEKIEKDMKNTTHSLPPALGRRWKWMDICDLFFLLPLVRFSRCSFVVTGFNIVIALLIQCLWYIRIWYFRAAHECNDTFSDSGKNRRCRVNFSSLVHSLRSHLHRLVDAFYRNRQQQKTHKINFERCQAKTSDFQADFIVRLSCHWIDLAHFPSLNNMNMKIFTRKIYLPKTCISVFRLLSSFFQQYLTKVFFEAKRRKCSEFKRAFFRMHFPRRAIFSVWKWFGVLFTTLNDGERRGKGGRKCDLWKITAAVAHIHADTVAQQHVVVASRSSATAAAAKDDRARYVGKTGSRNVPYRDFIDANTLYADIFCFLMNALHLSFARPSTSAYI